eukprot:m.61089 g.61089  ORF g.61089 m.61089 type:complete len:491 (-) comp17522_c0_seq2:170-1642(-)
MSGVGQHRGRGVTESPGSDNSEATGSVQDGHAQENPAAGPQQKTKRKMMKKKRGRVTSGTPSLTSETDIQALHGTMLEVNAHLAEIKHQMRRGSERYAFASDVVRKPHAEEVGDETQVETRTVYTRFNVINLHDVTAVSVNVRLYYELLWELPVEQQNTKSHGPLDPPSDWTKEWQPQVGMDNITGEVLTVREWLGVEMHVGRRMAFKRWIGEGTFQQTFDFSEFPFDSTEFKITLRSHLTTREVKLVDNLALHDPTEKTRWLRGDSNVGSVLSVDKFQLSHYWRIDHLPEIRDTTHLGVEPGLKGARPRIQLVIQGKRKAQYYYYNSILIFMVIVSLSFSVFCMPVTQLSERLNIVMSLVLSAVAHKLLCAEQLPDLPYLTYLDGYVRACCMQAVFSLSYHLHCHHTYHLRLSDLDVPSSFPIRPQIDTSLAALDCCASSPSSALFVPPCSIQSPRSQSTPSADGAWWSFGWLSTYTCIGSIKTTSPPP